MFFRKVKEILYFILANYSEKYNHKVSFILNTIIHHTGRHIKRSVPHGTPQGGHTEWHGYVDFIVRKGKRLAFSRKQAFSCVPFGGDKRDRTADLLNAIQALSQLSYTPIFFHLWKFIEYAVLSCRTLVARRGHINYDAGSQVSYTPTGVPGFCLPSALLYYQIRGGMSTLTFDFFCNFLDFSHGIKNSRRLFFMPCGPSPAHGPHNKLFYCTAIKNALSTGQINCVSSS